MGKGTHAWGHTTGHSEHNRLGNLAHCRSARSTRTRLARRGMHVSTAAPTAVPVSWLR